MTYDNLIVKDNVAILSIDVIPNPVECLPNGQPGSPITYLETNELFDDNGISIRKPSLFHCVFPSNTSLQVIDMYLDSVKLYRNPKTPIKSSDDGTYSVCLANLKKRHFQKSL